MMKLLGALALGVSLASAASGIHAASAPTQSVALRLSDLPVGFTLASGHFTGNAQAEKQDHLPSGTLTRHGRLSAYEEDFKKSALAGVLEVQSTVTYWKAAAGAQWQLSTSETAAKKTFRGQDFIPMSVGRLGSGSAGYELRETTSGYHIDLFIVLFERGRFAVYLAGDGLAGTVTADEVVSLAQVVDNRIRRIH